MGQTPWLTAVIGFMGGGIFMRLTDKVLPHLHPGLRMDQSEGIKTSWQRSTLLVLAITLHNIPEGLAIGVAFGAVASGLPAATIGGAIALAIGIGLQNFPEGTGGSALCFTGRRRIFTRSARSKTAGEPGHYFLHSVRNN
jgi:ZIP family zinc transporter